MSAGDVIIEVEKLTKIYGLLPVLRGLDFRILRGEFVALLGQNGSGKSSVLRLVAGLSKATAGTIRIGGWEMPREAMAVRAQIGLVAHQPLLYENLSARENLDFFGKLYEIPAAERKERIAELLRRVGLNKRADSLVRTFSRGMQQRLSIARALLHQPDVLLFDEPFTGLDQTAAELLDEILRSSRGQGRTVIMSTHQLGKLPGLADRALILSRGKIAFDGAIEDMSVNEMSDWYSRIGNGATIA